VCCWPLGCSQEITPPPLASSALRLEQPWPAPGQSALRINRRQVEVVFAQAGIAIVRVFGRAGGQGSLEIVSRQVAVE